MSTVSDSTSYSRSLQRLTDSYESELEKTRANQEKELERVRDSYREEMKESKDEARQEIRKLKEELYDSQGKRAASESKREHEQHARFAGYREATEKDSARRVESAQKYAESRMETIARENQDRIEEALQAQKNSHREEMKPVLEELALYRNEGRDPEAERAQARQEEIESFEGDHRIEKKTIVDSYERMLERMKNHEEELQDLYSRKLTEAEIGSNAKSREQVKRLKAEFAEAMKAQRAERMRVEQGLQEELRNERLRSEAKSKQVVARSQEDTSRALRDKDQAYLGFLETNAKRVNAEMKAREDVIRDLSTTNDPRRVSPALVEKLRTSEALRYEEKLGKLRESSVAGLSAIREKDAAERAAIRDRYEEMARTMGREIRKNSDSEKRELFMAYQDMSDLHSSKLQDIDGRARSAVAKLHQDQELSLVRQEKRNQMALEEQRDSLKEVKDREVEDLKLESRLKDREWSIKANDQRRELEKKLNTERDSHEREVAELKSEFQKKLHEQQRNSQRIVEEKDRSLSHQLKQQDLSHKEKERFLVEHYEEELDRMKRTNAQLIAKKS
ncbi:MAG: hypothetical protein KGP28_03350 [Bdellovibrionales bacterium]|nr:hypothetical protein [Bdellovibrionales bacterium]